MSLRYLIAGIGLFAFTSLVAQVPDDITQGFISKINDSRQAYSLNLLDYNTSLALTCKTIGEEHDKRTILTDDYIRSILRSNGNFDYNINLVEIKARNIESTLSKPIELIDNHLGEILNDPRINRLGVISTKIGGKHRILFLFSENYIEFDKYFIHELHVTPGGGRKFIVIPGKSRIEGITYNLQGTELNKAKSAMLGQENNFRVKIEITFLSEDAPRLIEFKNPEGRIVSLVNF